MTHCYSYTTPSGTTRIHVFLDHKLKCQCGDRNLRHTTSAPPADSDQLSTAQ